MRSWHLVWFKLVIIGFLGFTLSGCDAGWFGYQAPVINQITVDGNSVEIDFTPILSAREYHMDINGVDHVTTTSPAHVTLPDGNYTIKIRGLQQILFSKWSDPKTFVVNAFSLSQPIITNVTSDFARHAEISFLFSLDADFFEARILTAGGQLLGTLVVNESPFELDLPEGQYQIELRAKKGTTYSRYSARASLSMLIPKRVENLTLPLNMVARAGTSDPIEATWDAANSASVYEVWASTDKNFEHIIHHSFVNTTLKDIDISALEANTYWIYVKVCGWSQTPGTQTNPNVCSTTTARIGVALNQANALTYPLTVTYQDCTQVEKVGDTPRCHNLTRTAWVHFPANYEWVDMTDWKNPKPKHIPLVMNLPGGFGTSYSQMIGSRMNNAADEYKTIVVYPDGLLAAWNYGMLSWNAGTDTAAAQHNVDDVAFINALIDKMIVLYTKNVTIAQKTVTVSIDRNKIFMTGISNGGQMTYRYAMMSRAANPKARYPIAAIAAVASGIDSLDDYQPAGPIPAMVIHGLEDQHIMYEGGSNPVYAFGPLDYFPTETPNSRPALMNLIRTANHNAAVVRTNYVPYSGFTADPGINFKWWKTTTAGQADVVLVKVSDGGHTWPDGIYEDRMEWEEAMKEEFIRPLLVQFNVERFKDLFNLLDSEEYLDFIAGDLSFSNLFDQISVTTLRQYMTLRDSGALPSWWPPSIMLNALVDQLEFWDHKPEVVDLGPTSHKLNANKAILQFFQDHPKN